MGNPFVHIELTADDVGAAKKFYGSLFAWKLGDMPGMAYTGIDVGKGTGGGMQAKPMPEAPTGWLPYVEVADVKATIAKAISLGGRSMLDYMPIGDMGAIGILADPGGSPIGVWETAKKPVAKKSAAKKPAAKKPAAKMPTAKKSGKKKR